MVLDQASKNYLCHLKQQVFTKINHYDWTSITIHQLRTEKLKCWALLHSKIMKQHNIDHIYLCQYPNSTTNFFSFQNNESYHLQMTGRQTISGNDQQGNHHPKTHHKYSAFKVKRKTRRTTNSPQSNSEPKKIRISMYKKVCIFSCA